MQWHYLFLIALILILLWLTYQFIRTNPQSFSKDALNRGFWILGLLALGLIVFIGLLVLWLRG